MARFRNSVNPLPYPSPQGLINIDLDGFLVDKTFTIYDIMRQSIKTFKTGKMGVFQIKQVDLKIGVNLLKIWTELETQTVKLIVE